MIKTLKLTLPAVILLGTVAQASAVEFAGGSAYLTLGSVHDSGSSGGTYDHNGYGVDGTLSFTPQIAVTGYVAEDKLSIPATDVTDTTYGVTPTYMVSPAVTAGLFYEHHKLSIYGTDINNEVYGLEGTFAISDTISVTGFAGKVTGDSVFVGGDGDISGIRGDLTLAGGFGLYATYQRDDYSGEDVTRTAIGGNYDLSAMTGVPIMIEANYGSYGGSLTTGSDLTDYYIGARFLFGGKAAKSTGFEGEHSALFALY